MEREQQQKIMTYKIFKEVVDAIFLFIEPLIRGLKKISFCLQNQDKQSRSQRVPSVITSFKVLEQWSVIRFLTWLSVKIFFTIL